MDPPLFLHSLGVAELGLDHGTHVGVKGLAVHGLQGICLLGRRRLDLVGLRTWTAPPRVDADAAGVLEQGDHRGAFSVDDPGAEVHLGASVILPEGQLERGLPAVDEGKSVTEEQLPHGGVSLVQALVLGPLRRIEDAEVADPRVHSVPPGEDNGDRPGALLPLAEAAHHAVQVMWSVEIPAVEVRHELAAGEVDPYVPLQAQAEVAPRRPLEADVDQPLL
mmetsp:Transcript_32076/g.73056  ORF Transcript_32076/g.73056 Transcript_32076/m.73056 type:complete len:221 (-) Transcript_32076:145-807(-)